ncbi:DUF541 domain-containing protein [bacterium]|nr:MAG: DUF541 domain-containing protein [bacterium]
MNVRMMGTLSLMLLATLPVAALAQAGPAGAHPAILTVNGTASVAREPDVAHVNLSVETSAATAAAATGQNAALTARVRSALAGQGVPAGAVVTQYYNLRYVPRPEQTPPPSVLRRPATMLSPQGERYGYVVTHTLEITTTPAKAGAVIDAAVGAGATSVGNVVYDLANRHEALLEALRAAVADAQSQARAAASASGLRLGTVQRLFVGGEPRIAPLQTPMMRTLAAPVATQVEPGEVRVFATVSVTYELMP